MPSFIARQSVVSPFKDGYILKAGGFPPNENLLITYFRLGSDAALLTLSWRPERHRIGTGKASTKELLSRHLPNRAASEQ